MTICIIDIRTRYIFKAGLHNVRKRFILGAVGDHVNADLLVDFTDEGTIDFHPAAILGIQSFQSGGCQSTQLHIAGGGGIAGSGIVLGQGGAICRIECADLSVDICICLAGTQTNKHIIGKSSLQTCSAGYGFHPLVRGQGCVMAVAQIYQDAPIVHRAILADRAAVGSFGQVHVYQDITDFQVILPQFHGTRGAVVHIRPYPNTAIEVLYQHIVVNLIFCIRCGRGKFIHVPGNIAGIVE